MTIEGVKPEETRCLGEVLENEYNSKVKKASERMPLRKKGRILPGLNPSDALWGHIEIKDEGNIEKVLKILRKMSKTIPRLTWILYGENKIFGGELFLKDGRILNY